MTKNISEKKMKCQLSITLQTWRRRRRWQRVIDPSEVFDPPPLLPPATHCGGYECIIYIIVIRLYRYIPVSGLTLYKDYYKWRNVGYRRLSLRYALWEIDVCVLVPQDATDTAHHRRHRTNPSYGDTIMQFSAHYIVWATCLDDLPKEGEKTNMNIW